MRRPSSRRTDPRLALTAWGVLTGLLATGCVELPGDGPPEKVDMSQGAAAENLQVRVFPVAPYKGEAPDELLSGFLAAANADEADYRTAQQYLTSDAHGRWNPDAGVVVLAGTMRRTETAPKAEDTTAGIAVSGDKAAELDAQHSYRVATGESFQQRFSFVKQTEGPDKGEWRIEGLPDGLIVDQTTFKNNYRAAHRYFFAASDPSADHAAQVLAPDPIYLRRRIDPLTAAAKALAAGPSKWLAPAVSSAFDGVNITSPVSIGDSRVATVKVDTPDFTNRQQLCQQMAEQLYQTLADQQGKAQIDRLDLSGQKGGCSLGTGQAAATAPGSLVGSAATQPYYQLDTGQLMQMPGDGPGRPVPGPLGQPSAPGQAKLVAVRRDGAAAAAVSADGKALYVTGLGDADKLGDPVLSSRAPQADQGLGSPSWDGRGDLWVVDRDPSAVRVVMVRGRTPVPVQVDDLGDRTVQALRISSDGARVAVVLQDAAGNRTVMLGLVVHSGSATAPQVKITELRSVAPQLAGVASISWADTDQLLVLGQEAGKLQQLHYLGTDGSQSSDSPQQGGGESMTAVSATEARQPQQGDQLPPVLAISSEHRIYRLQGNQWRELNVQHNAISFTYPG